MCAADARTSNAIDLAPYRLITAYQKKKDAPSKDLAAKLNDRKSSGRLPLDRWSDIGNVRELFIYFHNVSSFFGRIDDFESSICHIHKTVLFA